MYKRICFILCFLIQYGISFAQVYTVNVSDDLDDGVCDGVHCSLREALKLSESDGVPSTILFNIPGAGPHNISPSANFPVVTQPDLTVDGNSQPGGPGSVVIKFAFRNFFGNPFWELRNKNIQLAGLSFTEFLFDNVGDCILALNNADNCQIRDCAFFADNNLNPVPEKVSVRIQSGKGIKIANNHFGTDRLKSSIVQTEAYIKIENSQSNNLTQIDSNLFVSRVQMIEIHGGLASLSKNIFGALDTSKSVNFLDPMKGISIIAADDADINDNFFFGFKSAAIDANNVNLKALIRKNRFYNNSTDILADNFINHGTVQIVDNYGRNGTQFLRSKNLFDIFVERNNIQTYDGFINADTPGSYHISRYMDNRFTCIANKPVIMPSRPVPVITSVNRNEVRGTALPNDSVVVYANNLLTCPGKDCRGGIELGRTLADAGGNFVLSAAYPNRNTITAYQFDSNPNANPRIHSELSNCYSCPGQVKIVFNPALCTGQSVSYRGKNYSTSNPSDSIFVRGDGVSICDSVILVQIQVQNAYRQSVNFNLCFGDTLRFGNVEIHKNHLVDSLNLKTSGGCDSVVLITAREVGVSNFSQTICDNASIVIGGTRFDKNNTSGTAIIAGAAQSGCDSVVFVNLMINNFSESFIDRTMCPGDKVIVSGKVFDETNLQGDVLLKNGSSTGCDSIVHVKLNYPNNKGTFTTTICNGDSVFVVDRFFSSRNTSATITITNGSSFGCDSILDVNINLLPNAQGSYTQDICRGDTVFIYGEPFFSGRTTGAILLANSAANGCDSTVNVSMNVRPDAIGNLDTSLCENQTLTYFGQTFSILKPRGSFKIPNGSQFSCDSFVNVNIVFKPEVSDTLRRQICWKDQIRVGSQTFSVNNPTGSVRLTGASSAGCDSVVVVELSSFPPLQLQFNTMDLDCNQANTGILELLNVTGGNGSNYQLTLDNASPVSYSGSRNFSGLSQGTHSLRISDPTTCDTVVSFTINPSQILALKLPADTTIKKGAIVNLNPTLNFIIDSIHWDPDLFLSCDTCLNTQAFPDQTISYTLTAFDQNGCSATDQITITVIVDQADIYVPNVFSPNGDNINDLFTPVFKFPEKTRIEVFRIFDRWGTLVYERLNGNVGERIGWDGNDHKEKCNPGVFTYTIQFAGEDNVSKWKTGDVTLIR